jgi:transcriptional regulator with XRE-family HTH domain
MLTAVFRANLGRAMQAHPDKVDAICRRAGYSSSYVRRVITGRRPNPTLSFVECMATALGASVADLLKEETSVAE